MGYARSVQFPGLTPIMEQHIEVVDKAYSPVAGNTIGTPAGSSVVKFSVKF